MTRAELKAALLAAIDTGKLLEHDEPLATMHPKRILRAIINELDHAAPAQPEMQVDVVMLSSDLGKGPLAAAMFYEMATRLRELAGDTMPERVQLVMRPTDLALSYATQPVEPVEPVQEPAPAGETGRELTEGEAADALGKAFEQQWPQERPEGEQGKA